MLESVRTLVAAGAMLLIGVHLAFVASTIHVTFVNWFRTKVVACLMFLTYLAIGLYFSNPGWERTTLAAVAVLVDLVAVAMMWCQVTFGLKTNLMGLVPIVTKNGKPYETIPKR